MAAFWLCLSYKETGGLKLSVFMHPHGSLQDTIAQEVGVPCWDRPNSGNPSVPSELPGGRGQGTWHSQSCLNWAQLDSLHMLPVDSSQIPTRHQKNPRFLLPGSSPDVESHQIYRLVSRAEAVKLLGFADGLRPSLDEPVSKYSLLILRFPCSCLRDLLFWHLHLLRDWYSLGYSL